LWLGFSSRIPVTMELGEYGRRQGHFQGKLGRGRVRGLGEGTCTTRSNRLNGAAWRVQGERGFGDGGGGSIPAGLQCGSGGRMRALRKAEYVRWLPPFSRSNFSLHLPQPFLWMRGDVNLWSVGGGFWGFVFNGGFCPLFGFF
jgi:hypothetical protein